MIFTMLKICGLKMRGQGNVLMVVATVLLILGFIGLAVFVAAQLFGLDINIPLP